MQSEKLADSIVNQKGWCGEVKLTEKGVKQLIEFCYKKGYNAAMKKNNKEPAVKPNEFENIFGDIFKTYTGKKY